MSRRPSYVLAAAALGKLRLAHFNDDGPGSPRRLLENPPSFRWAGFDLTTMDEARSISPDAIEVRNGNRKVVQLFRDTTLLFRVAADEEFLGWGVDQDVFDRRPRLNPVAVVEAHTAFAHLYSKVLDHVVGEPKEVRIHLGLRWATSLARPLFLTPYTSRNYDVGALPKYAANGDILDEDFRLGVTEVRSFPNAVAYKLLTTFYGFFDMPEEKIPFVTEVEGRREIDVEALRKL